LLSFTFLSCEDESVLNENQDATEHDSFLSKNSSSISATLTDGRLVFETLSDFHDSMNTLKRIDEDSRRQIFDDFYQNGFVPLYPYYKAEIDDDLIEEYLNLKKEYTPNVYTFEDFSLEDPLIASDNFASFLNIKREIIIGDEIYAYTYQGLIKTETRNLSDLYDFIDSNNAYKTEIDPTNSTPGYSTPTSHPTLQIWTNPIYTSETSNCGGMGEPNFDMTISPNHDSNNPSYFNPMDDYNCNNYGAGGTNTSNNNEDPHLYTDLMNQYIENLQECNIVDGNSWFGDNKICYEYFDGGKRRTRSKYYNNDYVVYAEIGMKVKHQRKRDAVFFTYWDRKETDEVALIINQATYKKTAPNTFANQSIHNFNFPTNNNNGSIFYVGQNAFSSPLNPVEIVPESVLPKTPFDEDIIIQFFSTTDIPLVNQVDLDAEEIREFFYENAYDAAKQIFKSISGNEEPTKYTMLINTEQSVIVHYVDESRRHLNENVINERLDHDLGGEISISLSFDEFGNIIADPSSLLNASMYDFDTVDLMEFEDAYVDFIGLSRRGEEWKGSSFVWYGN